MSELIDIHSHIYPPVYLDMLRARDRFPRVRNVDGEDRFIIFAEEDDPVEPKGRPIGEDFHSLDAKLSFMDEVGIARTVLSVGNPWLDPFTGSESIEHAARINEAMGRMAADTDGRIIGLGLLPNASPDDAAETVRELSNTGIRGIITGPRICGRLLDDGELDVVFAALNETRLPWLLHPSDGAAGDDLEGYGHSLHIGVGFPFETTVAVVRLVFGGALERFPDINLIASHGGGTLPFLAARIDAAWRSDSDARRRLSTPPSRSLARLHLDAVTYHERALLATDDLAQGKIAFGTDHPFSVSDPAENLDAIARAFDDGDRDRVRWRHAVDLFRLG